MKRSLKLPLLVALALGSSHALALDLGQIQVKSALGQPLLAEIPVQKATPAELQQLHVQLASGDAFARAGVAAGRPAIPLSFDVVDAGAGRKVIRITSVAAVNDPFLDLLIEINGGHGKSVREYTILLDPPGSHPAPVAAARPAAPARAARPATAGAVARAAAPRPSQAAGSQLANGRFGPVQRGQNLSSIAQQALPSGVDLNQMMLALKQANPNAFYRDNINALKAGAVLRVPSQAEAEAVAVAQAAAEVRRQNGDWRSGSVSSSPVTVADAGTRASTSSSPSARAASKDDHLALLPAKESAKAAVGTGGRTDKALQQDLLRNQEALASLQQQSDNLKSRLKDLTDINSKNERLLALKDNEIAELQKKLAAARKAAGQPTPAAAAKPAANEPVAAALASASSAPAATSLAPATASTASVAAAASTAVAHVATVAAASQPAPVAPAKTAPLKAEHAKPAPAKPQPLNEQPWYQQLWVQALGAGVVILLLLLTLFGRRKPKAAAKLAPSLADRFGGAPAVDDAEDDDQNRLLDQLAEQPDDIGLHLELASLYYGRRDVEHFEAAAEAMQAHVVDPQQDEWREVLRMGEDLAPGHPLFSQHGETVADEPARSEFDIDQFAAGHESASAFAPEPEAAPAVPPPFPAEPVKVSEYNFNFDLTPEPSRAAAVEADAEPAFHEDDADKTVLHDTASSWHFDEPAAPAPAHDEPLLDEPLPAGHDIEPTEFSDDPSDTKLDLARAYLDMGDPEGARAMLEEVLQEGSQTQRDMAKRMLDDMR